MYVRTRKPAVGTASARTSRYDTCNARYINTQRPKNGTTEVARARRLRPRSGRAKRSTDSRHDVLSRCNPPEPRSPSHERLAPGLITVRLKKHRTRPAAYSWSSIGTWRVLLKLAGWFSRCRFLEHESIVLEQLAFEADAVGAHARGEREPEVGAGEPAAGKAELQQRFLQARC